jgi:hypothetical protein
MIFQFSLESGMSLSPTKNTHGVFSVTVEGQGQVPLPRVKVVGFLRGRYESVMLTSRRVNGAHGCLMSPHQVCYHLKVEQLFGRRPRRGLVLTDNHQALRLAWARIHSRFTKASGALVVGRRCIWSESSWKHLELCQKKWYPPPFLATLMKWKAMCNRLGSSQQICQTIIQRYICLWDSAVWPLSEPEVAIRCTSSILWFFIWRVCPVNGSSLRGAIKY